MLIICDKWRSLHYYGKIRNDYTHTLIFRSGKSRGQIYTMLSILLTNMHFIS